MTRASDSGKGPIEIIEEAFHLLRMAPLRTFLAYYIGTAPFILGVLFFWSDMSRGAFADDRLAAETMGLVLAFFWMKTWQAIYARRLRGQISGIAPEPLTPRRVAQIAINQMILQPSGLFLIPIALLLLFPIGWVYGFYQSVTALGGLEDGRTLLRKSLKQTVLWPLQNNYVVFLFKAFGLFVFFNIFSGVLMIPYLLSALLGIETLFVQSPWTFLNTTFFAAIAGLTYLAVDPVIKAVYVLRCFYGESRQTAEDLKAELRVYAVAAQKAAAVLLLATICLGFGVTQSFSAEPVAQPSAPAVQPNDLNHAIDEVLQRTEYTWRLPREKKPETEQKGIISQWVGTIIDWITALGKKCRGLLDRIEKWLSRAPPTSSPNRGLPLDWLGGAKALILLLLIAIVGLLFALLVRVWRGPQEKASTELSAEALAPAPDIGDENVGADQLPEDGWITMARELLARGEFRLALRAFYLASLAHLAQRNLISIARFKSNRDYERELGRRAHALPELMSTFTENVSTFDRVWYGTHEVNPILVENFQRNVERIKTS
jgi:hypothetical protein